MNTTKQRILAEIKRTASLGVTVSCGHMSRAERAEAECVRLRTENETMALLLRGGK